MLSLNSGPGFSKTLPIDILKIDRSFTNDPTSQSLVKLIIDTGHLLGASVTAEGVETHAVADDLTDMGSDDLQGFLYARPVPPEQLERLGFGAAELTALSADSQHRV